MTFGSDGFIDSLVMGVRLVGVLVVAAMVSRLSNRQAELLVAAVLVITCAGAAMAAFAWLATDKAEADVVGVTRAEALSVTTSPTEARTDGGQAAGPNNLGLWIAVSIATLVGGAVHVAEWGGQ